MGVYDGFADAPNQIKSEGQQINVAFIRNGDGTGTIRWNIPSPVDGCSSEDQAYDGIVITVSDKPANYIESSPSDGIYYNADPTFDSDLHSGSTLDDARVVGAFYHDKTTTTLLVQNVTEKTPYYVSAYAVDGVARYHREGVHAYSLPTDSLEPNYAEDSPARQDIGLEVNPILNGTLTGLESGTDYTFSIIINGTTYDITIEGHDALTYPDLVNAINKQFIEITDAERTNLETTDKYYYDATTKKLYEWVYDEWVERDVTVDEDDPSSTAIGSYWYNGTKLYIYESGGWSEVTVLNVSFDPSDPTCNMIWFDGSDVWMWENTYWRKLYTYTQTTDPSLPPTLDCGDHWYDESDLVLKQWSTDIDSWKEVDAIYMATNPNSIVNGDYWYDSTNSVMKSRVAGAWNELVNIDYEERNDDGDLTSPEHNQYWYIPSEQEFYRRNSTNTAWVSLDFSLAPSDPTVRSSGDLWWNSSISIDDLFVWDEAASDWVAVGSFTQSVTDPALPALLEENSVWYNPTDGTIKMLTTVDCSFNDIEFVESTVDPRNLATGTVWYDGSVFKEFDGVDTWTTLDPILSPSDPYTISAEDYWFDETNELLKQWSGSEWVTFEHLTEAEYPTLNEIVLHDLDETLYTWNGTTWVETDAIANVILIRATSPSEENGLRFLTTATGCDTSISVVVEAENLFTQLTSSVVYYDPVDGNSRLENGPTWNELGLGDDGSPDERRAMHKLIRERLGHPTQRVELTADQIDEALNSALSMIRKYSGFGYHRMMFFLDVLPNQQKYVLTNKCVGFNKITSINNIYRLRSGFLSGNISRGGYDVFGYAALLHLYRTGTFDMLSYHLVSSYIEDMRIMFADHITYNWVEYKRELRLHHVIYDKERVLLDAFVEVTEQELFTNRETREWIKRWTMAECKMMLSQVRGKYQTLPGPNGTTTLNSQELITQADAEKAELKEELEDPAMQNLQEAGMGAHFIMG